MSKHTVKFEQEQSNVSASSLLMARVGLVDCYDFVCPNEYSEDTLGLFAWFLRKGVGDINFSDILNDFLLRAHSRQAIDLLTLLRHKREHLQDIDASIEKCLMLNRWIKHIEETKSEILLTLIGKVQEGMNNQMIDNRINQMVNYPDDFRQRERDFQRRVDAQRVRRLFYYSLSEAKAPSIIYLQNRTTEHLNYLINSKMRYDSTFRDIGVKELEKIFRTAFVITKHPQCGSTPVLVYERQKDNIYKAKISVTIVSVLYDFMATNPGAIVLENIQPALSSSENCYELVENQQFPWKTCELKMHSQQPPKLILCAELNEILIKETSAANKQKHLGDELYSLDFLITLRFNFNEQNISNLHRIPLRSLPFAISTHKSHVPYFMTKLLIRDIQEFSQVQSANLPLMLDFIKRYFMHRTGVNMKDDLQTYINNELTKAKNAHPNDQSVENVFMNILFPLVNQIEFMAKHPILLMFYTDELFLGICHKEHVANIMNQVMNVQSSIVALRLNSIGTTSESSNNNQVVNKSMKADTCFVRIDIYNTRTQFFQNRTFNPKELLVDILNFVSTAREAKGDHVRILSTTNNLNDLKTYRFFTKYYDDRLHRIYKGFGGYKPLIELLVHIEEKPTHHSANDRQNINAAYMSVNGTQMDPSSLSTNGNNQATVFNQNPNVQLITTDMSMETNSVPFVQQPLLFSNEQELMDYVVSQPRLFRQIVHRFREMHGLPPRPSITNINVQQYPQTTFDMTSQANLVNSYVQLQNNSVQFPSESTFADSSKNLE